MFNVYEWSYQVSYLRHRFLPSWPFWEPCSWYTHWCCYLDEEFWGKNLNAVFTLENENHNISALGECTTRIYQEYWGHYHHRGGASNAGSYLLIGKNLQPKRLPIFANSFIYTANDFGDQSILYNETKTSQYKKTLGYSQFDEPPADVFEKMYARSCAYGMLEYLSNGRKGNPNKNIQNKYKTVIWWRHVEPRWLVEALYWALHRSSLTCTQLKW